MFDPRALFMLVVLVAVTGYVARGLMVSWYKLNRGEKPSGSNVLNDMEERLRKVEAATSSILVDVSSMREKQRFMARLQAGATVQQESPALSEGSKDAGPSPMVIQSMPAIPRATRH